MKFYERVISDFGGYEKCKDILSQPNIDLIMNAQGLRAHMLEYRRQHNIFEVGDICKLKIKHDFGLYKFRRIEGDRAYLEDGLGFAEFGINKHVVEHATNEEIAAGKRLEVMK